jgi:hypothetical protein
MTTSEQVDESTVQDGSRKSLGNPLHDLFLLRHSVEQPLAL